MNQSEAVAAEPLGTVRNFRGSGSRSVTGPGPNTPVDRLQAALRAMPRAGDEFAGFRLVRELGRGSFGRVYLATQPDLGGRPVALKLSADLTGESRTLAQLQHTNIVPVYSVHRTGVFDAVCMPYLGSSTFADLIQKFRSAAALPATGRELVNTLRDLTGATRRDPLADSLRALDLADSRPSGATPKADPVFGLLAGLSYPDAVCWLVARVADGLAHAHDRGFVHRDVKPANVLVTDDGQPMLLDFGVAEDLTVWAATDEVRVGGTIPYMAPEHLAEIGGGGRRADHRSDLYSLGVIMYELLTGRHPFRPPAANVGDELPALVAERTAWVPAARQANPDVRPDLEAIVRRCVTADPAGRYQSAHDLRDDLERHLRSEPLKVAAEPSMWESVLKWRRRHPRLPAQLTVAAGVAAAAALSVGTVIAGKRLDDERREQARRDADLSREATRQAAVRRFDSFQDEFRRGRYLLTNRWDETAARGDGLEQIRRAVGGYAVADDPAWQARPAFAALSDDQKVALKQTLADGYLYLARGELQGTTDAKRLAVATRFNALAETLRDGPPPRAVLTQRAELLAKRQEPADAVRVAEQAKATPLVTAEDYTLSGNEVLAGGRPADAVPLFRAAVRLDPRRYWAHFGLGVAYHSTGRYADAIGCFGVAVALGPDDPWPYFNRAMAAICLNRFDDAADDLTVVLAREPHHPAALYHRALAHDGRGDRAAALQDLGAVLAGKDPGGLHARTYLTRAKVRRAAGDVAGAKADLDAGVAYTPTTETGWLARGYARMTTDPAAALADFEQALKLNPDSIPGRVNQAYVLEQLGRNEECLPVLDRLIRLQPEVGSYVTGRAVLLARLKRYDEAIAVAEKVSVTGSAALLRYQAACVYALAGREKPAWRAEAFRYLAAALDGGYPPAEAEKDPDVEPIRGEPEFRRLIEAAKKK